MDIDDVDDESSVIDEASKCYLYQRIRETIEVIEPDGFTATTNALETARQILLNSRLNSKKAVFLITDGKADIGPPPVRTAFELRTLRWNQTWDASNFGPQLEIYAIGIDQAEVPELESIVSDPHHLLLIPSFPRFAQLVRSLHRGKKIYFKLYRIP